MNCASCGSLENLTAFGARLVILHTDLDDLVPVMSKEYECEVCETPFRFNEWNEGYAAYLWRLVVDPICEACWDDHYFTGIAMLGCRYPSPPKGLMVQGLRVIDYWLYHGDTIQMVLGVDRNCGFPSGHEAMTTCVPCNATLYSRRCGAKC